MCICHLNHSDFASFVELNPEQVISEHIDIDWEIDFEESQISGHVDIKCKRQQVGPCVLTLDSRDLEIESVHRLSERHHIKKNLKFKIVKSEHSATLGHAITIPLEDQWEDTYYVRVKYSTSPKSSALQWLTPEQTSSGKLPFVFSQCQAIHARSLLPCQDLCQVKVTYAATIRCPSSHTALMSAKMLTRLEHEGTAYATYAQTVPIPSYLIAVACGDVVSRKLGPRSTVWAERSVVELAATEFEDTERMIQVAESLCGPYRFDVFDLLVLPRSYPYGGMENPCLTFVTPTLLAGDKSQVAVIAHELAHSWSGNLVTNKTWQDFWLNEGLTVFTETKIVKKLFGAEAASIRLQEGWDHLGQYVDETGKDHNHTRLCPEMPKGADPDDAFSVVPYEKGASLFWFLQSLVGEPNFEKFIIEFFNHFAFKTVSSTEFMEYVNEHLEGVGGRVDWSAWFSAPGMPSYKPPVDMAPVEEARQLAQSWLSGSHVVSPEEASAVSTQWPSGKKCLFINTLLGGCGKLTEKHISEMTKHYKFLETNCEVRCGFITLMLRAGASDTAKKEAVKLATEQGRMKFTRPMYRELFKVDPKLAKKMFETNKNLYHPICAKMVAKDLS